MISIISILRAIYWEIKIDLLSTLRYRFGIISDLVIYSMLLGFFFTSKTNTSIEREFIYLNYQELLFWGYIAWTLAVAAISSIGGEIRSELIHGTFYGKMNSKYPLQILLFGKLISSVIIQVCITLILSFFAIVIWSVQIRFNFLLFLFLAICTIGMYGLGLFLGGLALYFKKIGAIVFIIKFALLFITDTIPTNEYIIFFLDGYL